MIGRLKQVPAKYQALYERAMSGKSRKAAMRVFCLECCGWEIKEVFLCTDVGCSLHPYRPTSRIPPGSPEALPDKPESKNSEQMVLNYG